MLNQKDDNSFNSIIGIVLIFVILIGYSIYTQPSPEQIEAARQKRDLDSVMASEAKSSSDEKPIAPTSQDLQNEDNADVILPVSPGTNDSLQDLARKKFGAFANAANGKEQEFTLENERIKVYVSTLGGRITSVELKEYQTHDSLPLFLFKGQ